MEAEARTMMHAELGGRLRNRLPDLRVVSSCAVDASVAQQLQCAARLRVEWRRAFSIGCRDLRLGW